MPVRHSVGSVVNHFFEQIQIKDHSGFHLAFRSKPLKRRWKPQGFVAFEHLRNHFRRHFRYQYRKETQRRNRMTPKHHFRFPRRPKTTSSEAER